MNAYLNVQHMHRIKENIQISVEQIKSECHYDILQQYGNDRFRIVSMRKASVVKIWLFSIVSWLGSIGILSFSIVS